MAAPSERPSELIQGINVTPLVDIVLVLLIALMVAATHAVSHALPMELPRANTGETSDTVPLTISVTADGTTFMDGRKASRDEVRARARQISKKPGGSALIAADGGAEHRAVVSVIDLLRSEGVGRFAINVAPEDTRR
jgi:biopolymer transport protein ExbD